MPKIDILSLPRPNVYRETKTFVDPVYKISITLTIQTTRETVELSEVIDFADALMEKVGPGQPPIQWHGRDMKVSRSLCNQIAAIMTFDAGELKDRYSFDEWVAISAAMRSTFNEISFWVAATCGKENDPLYGDTGELLLPKGCAESGEATSAPHSNTPEPPTQTS